MDKIVEFYKAVYHLVPGDFVLLIRKYEFTKTEEKVENTDIRQRENEKDKTMEATIVHCHKQNLNEEHGNFDKKNAETKIWKSSTKFIKGKNLDSSLEIGTLIKPTHKIL